MKIIARLEDHEFPFTYIDHVRKVARGIVLNDKNQVAINKLHGFDQFGSRNGYETPGGGVEKGETYMTAVKREMEEEIGYSIEVVSTLGMVIDYYNLIHRLNHSVYFLCKAKQPTPKHFTDFEKKIIEGTVWMDIDEAIAVFENMQDKGFCQLVKNRELPVLKLVQQIIKSKK